MIEESFEVKSVKKADKSKDKKSKDEVVVELNETVVEEELVIEELVEEPVVEETPKKAEKPKVNEDSVALFANGAIYQAKWGELAKGYNIVKKEAAEYWLSHTSRVRLATPEEVAKHYGIK